jgi:hypothetical protein
MIDSRGSVPNELLDRMRQSDSRLRGTELITQQGTLEEAGFSPRRIGLVDDIMSVSIAICVLGLRAHDPLACPSGIEERDSFPYLGTTLDSKLTFDPHYTLVRTRIWRGHHKLASARSCPRSALRNGPATILYRLWHATVAVHALSNLPPSTPVFETDPDSDGNDGCGGCYE